MEQNKEDPRIEKAKQLREKVKHLEKYLATQYSELDKERKRLEEIEKEFKYHPGPSLHYQETQAEIQQVSEEIEYYEEEANTLEFEIVRDGLSKEQQRERGFIE